MTGQQILNKFLLSLLAVLISMYVAEIAFRIYGYVHGIDYRLYETELVNPKRLPLGLFIPDPYLEGTLRPNSQFLATTSDFSVVYKINSQGMRDKEYDPSPKNVLRFLAFGDSFTFGEGISYGNRYADIPENRLKNVEILNFGIPGIGFDKILLQTQVNVKKYHPRYVLVFLTPLLFGRHTYTLDDLDLRVQQIAHDETLIATASGTSSYLNREEIAAYSRKNILSVSYLFSYLQYQWRVRQLHSLMAKHDKNLWSAPEAKSENVAIPEASSVHTDTSISRDAAIAQRLVDICERALCRIVFVNITPSKLDIPLPKNSTYIDLSQKLLVYKATHPLSFTYDPHYNGQTHRFIGDALTKIIQEQFVRQ